MTLPPAAAATFSAAWPSADVVPRNFGPPPSETNPSLVGPVQLLKSGTVDHQKGTITLPLYQ
jgi:hypothetical protein